MVKAIQQSMAPDRTLLDRDVMNGIDNITVFREIPTESPIISVAGIIPTGIATAILFGTISSLYAELKDEGSLVLGWPIISGFLLGSSIHAFACSKKIDQCIFSMHHLVNYINSVVAVNFIANSTKELMDGRGDIILLGCSICIFSALFVLNVTIPAFDVVRKDLYKFIFPLSLYQFSENCCSFLGKIPSLLMNEGLDEKVRSVNTSTVLITTLIGYISLSIFNR